MHTLHKISLALVVAVSLLLGLSAKPTPVKAAAVADFVIASKNNATADSINKFIAGRPDSPAQGLGKEIMAYSKQYGINAAYVIAVMTQESNLGAAYVGSNYKYHNWGGVGQDSHCGDNTNAACIIKFQFSILSKYNTVGVSGVSPPMHTIGAVLNTYCPLSDNCPHALYLSNLGNFGKEMGENFGDSSGSTMVGTGVDESSVSGDGSDDSTKDPEDEWNNTPIKYIPRTSLPVNTKSAVVTGDNGSFTQSMVTAATSLADKLFKTSNIFTAFFVVTMVAYIAIAVLVYIMGFNGFFSSNKALAKGTKVIIGGDPDYTKKGILKYVVRAMITLVLIAVLISGMYLLIYSTIFGFASTATSGYVK